MTLDRYILNSRQHADEILELLTLQKRKQLLEQYEAGEFSPFAMDEEQARSA